MVKLNKFAASCLAAAALLALGSKAWAQHGHGYGYRGHHHHSHRHHGHHPHGHHHHHGGFGFYINPYYYGGHGFGPFGGYGHSGHYDGYGFFGNSYRVNEPRSVTVLLPTNIVNLEVRLPEAEGECWLGGVKQRGQGTVRRFQTPELEPGISYTYRVSAAWHNNGQFVTEERRVKVQANSSVVVDFTKPEAPAGKPAATTGKPAATAGQPAAAGEVPPPAEPSPAK